MVGGVKRGKTPFGIVEFQILWEHPGIGVQKVFGYRALQKMEGPGVQILEGTGGHEGQRKEQGRPACRIRKEGAVERRSPGKREEVGEEATLKDGRHPGPFQASPTEGLKGGD